MKLTTTGKTRLLYLIATLFIGTLALIKAIDTLNLYNVYDVYGYPVSSLDWCKLSCIFVLAFACHTMFISEVIYILTLYYSQQKEKKRIEQMQEKKKELFEENMKQTSCLFK